MHLKLSYLFAFLLALTSIGDVWCQTQANHSANKRKIIVEKPDLDQIREETLNPKSQFYFPKLMKKFINGKDTLMTHEEFRYLYLGYMFQEDYDPYRISPYSEITNNMILNNAPQDSIMIYAEKAIRDNPFDLLQMSHLVNALKALKKNMRSKVWEYRLEHLLAAIKSTGTGEDVENAWYVIYPSHEYDLVRLLGYEATDVDFIEPAYDHLIVQPDAETKKRLRDKAADGFFFNVVIPTQQYVLKHPENVEVVEVMELGADEEN